MPHCTDAFCIVLLKLLNTVAWNLAVALSSPLPGAVMELSCPEICTLSTRSLSRLRVICTVTEELLCRA